jgi:alcohol dehydrogenase class IV
MYYQEEDTVIRDLEYLQQMYPTEAKKYQKMARIVGLPAATPKVGVANLIAEIVRLLKYMDRPMCITECGISLEEFEANREEIIKRALADACTVANPRKVSADDISKILDEIAK